MDVVNAGLAVTLLFCASEIADDQKSFLPFYMKVLSWAGSKEEYVTTGRRLSGRSGAPSLSFSLEVQLQL